MTQRWELGGGGLGWLLPYRPSPPPPVGHSSFYLAFPHLPCFCRPPLHGQEKGTETRKEGSRKGGAVLHPLTQPKPQGAWGQGKALVPSPPPPRNPHSRRGTPQIRNTLLLLLPRHSWRQGPHLYKRAVSIYIRSNGSLLGRPPQSGEPSPQNLLSLELESGLWGEGDDF